jgi:hypothetical protein
MYANTGALYQALQLIAQRATPEAAQAVAAVVPYPAHRVPARWRGRVRHQLDG